MVIIILSDKSILDGTEELRTQWQKLHMDHKTVAYKGKYRKMVYMRSTVPLVRPDGNMHVRRKCKICAH